MKYRDWAPTGFDPQGLGLPERQDWTVAPVIRTRDSGPLETSNFVTVEAELDEVDPEGDDHGAHAFGHWGPGWVEILLTRPGSRCDQRAEEFRSALENYPILDEDDHSERELEQAQETWAACYASEWEGALVDALPEGLDEELRWNGLADYCAARGLDEDAAEGFGLVAWEPDGDGVYFRASNIREGAARLLEELPALTRRAPNSHYCERCERPIENHEAKESIPEGWRHADAGCAD